MSGNGAALDTNRAIALLNGDATVLRLLERFATMCLPVPVVGELRFGAMNSARVASNLAAVESLTACCRVVAADRHTATSYSEVRQALKLAGKPIPENDVWIAAICLQHGLPLATDDRHFGYVPGLVVLER